MEKTMQEHDYAQVEQQYYRHRHQSSGWQSLVQVLFSGILSSADDEDGRRFLTLMGGDLARQYPLPAAATLGELENNLNQLFSHFDWGVVKIEATQQYLQLVHLAWPAAPQTQDAELWRIALIALLEGAYAEWLQAQGGQATVPLRWQESSREGALLFRYQNGL